MINPLNLHYAFNSPASIHDEEALTALELAGRQGAKINEIVKDQNNLRTETENHLQEQDADIENQKKVVIPDTINNVIEKHIKEGSFKEQIDDHTSEILLEIKNTEKTLGGRLDNLLGQVTEGTSTMDAEIIDGRTDYGGTIHDTLGTHIREVTSKPRFFESDIIKGNYQTVLTHNYKEVIYGETVPTYTQTETDSFSLPAGNYVLIVSDTNMVKVIVGEKGSTSDISKRLVNSNLNRCQDCFKFSLETKTDNLVITFNLTYSTEKEAGTYYAKYYLFKLEEYKSIIPEFVTNQITPHLLNSHEVQQNHKNLFCYTNTLIEHNGVKTYDRSILGYVTLNIGEYLAVVEPTNLITIVLTDISDSSRPLYLTNYNGVGGCHKFTVNKKGTFEISMNASLSTSNTEGTYYCSRVMILTDNGKPLLPDYLTRYDEIVGLIESKATIDNGYFVATSDTLGAGESLQITKQLDVKKNKTLIFHGGVTSFDVLTVGHGLTSYGGSCVNITNSLLETYNYTTSAAKTKSVSHGLTISDFITVIIQAKVDKADITIFTGTGKYTVEDVSWSGCNGFVVASSVGSVLTDCSIKWTTSDIIQPIWVFGDSYLGISSSERYPSYLLNMGFTNWLASGYPGGGSSPELETFQNLLEIGRPKKIIWCLGMNNPDNGSVNSSWMSCVNSLITLCEKNSIELILATIPNTPTRDNTYKNEYVVNSGYRYIDFAKAVVEEGTTWKDGTLSTDNVHPTELGAKYLASRFILDVPEITI